MSAHIVTLPAWPLFGGGSFAITDNSREIVLGLLVLAGTVAVVIGQIIVGWMARGSRRASEGAKDAAEAAGVSAASADYNSKDNGGDSAHDRLKALVETAVSHGKAAEANSRAILDEWAHYKVWLQSREAEHAARLDHHQELIDALRQRVASEGDAS